MCHVFPCGVLALISVKFLSAHTCAAFSMTAIFFGGNQRGCSHPRQHKSLGLSASEVETMAGKLCWGRADSLPLAPSYIMGYNSTAACQVLRLGHFLVLLFPGNSRLFCITKGLRSTCKAAGLSSFGHLLIGGWQKRRRQQKLET